MVQSNADMQVPFDLNRLVIPNPCTVGWETMTGDQRVRHCKQCDRNVYNLAELTSDEAVALIENAGDRICGRLLRRNDGTVVTKECPTNPATNSSHRRIQFSIGSLLFLMTFAAGVFVAIPVVGPKVADVLQRWFVAPAANPTPTTGYFVEGEIMLIDEDFEPADPDSKDV